MVKFHELFESDFFDTAINEYLKFRNSETYDKRS